MQSNMDASQCDDFSLYQATGSQESIRNLSRHRDRIERDMASKTEYDKKFVAQCTRADITEIEVIKTQLLVVYSQQQRSGTGNDITSMCDGLHQEWFDWVRTANQRNTKNRENIASVMNRELVERTPFPSFDGLQEG